MHTQPVNHDSAIAFGISSKKILVVLIYRMDAAEFARIVRSRLEETGQSPYRAAVSHGLPRDAIRYVLSGRIPRLDRVAEICEALGLELHVGPRRPVPRSAFEGSGAVPISDLVNPTRELVRLIYEAGGDPVSDELRRVSPRQGQDEDPK